MERRFQAPGQVDLIRVAAGNRSVDRLHRPPVGGLFEGRLPCLRSWRRFGVRTGIGDFHRGQRPGPIVDTEAQYRKIVSGMGGHCRIEGGRGLIGQKAGGPPPPAQAAFERVESWPDLDRSRGFEDLDRLDELEPVRSRVWIEARPAPDDDALGFGSSQQPPFRCAGSRPVGRLPPSGSRRPPRSSPPPGARRSASASEPNSRRRPPSSRARL